MLTVTFAIVSIPDDALTSSVSYGFVPVMDR
jgi:hypothetical protein